MNDADVARSILETIPRAVRFIRAEMRVQATGDSKTRLTVPQFRILVKLSSGPDTHKAVAEWMGVTPATLTRMVDTLVERKLVVRKNDPSDRRQTHLILTAAGTKLCVKYRSRVQAKIQDRMTQISEADKKHLSLGLAVLFDLVSEKIILIAFLMGAVLSIPSAHACFDFNTKVLQPIRPAPTQFEIGKDEAKSVEGDLDWAETSGVVEKPISELYQMLLDPHTIRNGGNTRVVTTEIPTPLYLKKIDQDITVKPVFFLTLNWKETWAYVLKDGTPEDPKSILISYEKKSGTSHIHHLCGNILLQSLKPKETGVYLYEELNGDRRTAQDVLNGIKGTLHTLRAPVMAKNEKPSPAPTAKQYKN